MTNRSDQLTLSESAGVVVEAYVDGSCLDNGSDDAVAGVGGVIVTDGGRDADEIGVRVSFEERTTSVLAEYAAVLEGLAQVEDQHSTDVIVHVYSDSETVVRQLQGSYGVRKNHLKEPHQETQEFLGEFREWRVEHLSEDESRYIQRADELAKAAARGEPV